MTGLISKERISEQAVGDLVFSTDVFLRINGWQLKVSADEGESFIVEILKDSDSSFDIILSWIRQSIVTN